MCASVFPADRLIACSSIIIIKTCSLSTLIKCYWSEWICGSVCGKCIMRLWLHLSQYLWMGKCLFEHWVWHYEIRFNVLPMPKLLYSSSILRSYDFIAVTNRQTTVTAIPIKMVWMWIQWSRCAWSKGQSPSWGSLALTSTTLPSLFKTASCIVVTLSSWQKCTDRHTDRPLRLSWLVIRILHCISIVLWNEKVL